ncbi:MAG: hypothetical protein OEZ22_09985 [Spirochaetia bacterium]|nr:hypothetical protein [Spirochaetia bacterium]
MKKYIKLCIVFYIYFTNIYATVVIQKNGDVIKGTIVKESEEKLIFDSSYGTLHINKEKIKKLIIDETAIEEETITYENKEIRVKHLFDHNDERIYLTNEGKIIKIKQKKQDFSVKITKRHLFSVEGKYKIERKAMPRAEKGPDGLNFILESKFLLLNGLGSSFSYMYVLNSFLGAGAFFEYEKFTAADKFETPIHIIDTSVVNKMILAGAVSQFSFLNMYGTQNNKYDVGIGAGLAYGLISSILKVSMKPNPNSPSPDENIKPLPEGAGPLEPYLEGEKRTVTLDTHLYFNYSITSMLNIVSKFGYQISLYNLIYKKTKYPETNLAPPYHEVNHLSEIGFDFPQSIYINMGLQATF